MTTLQPSRASAVAQALPSPREEAHTMALRPLILKSMLVPIKDHEGVGSVIVAWRTRRTYGGRGMGRREVIV